MSVAYRSAAIAFAASAATLAQAAALPFAGLRTDYSYVELANMALAARVVIAADIAEAIPLKADAAAGVAPDVTRYYVQADVRALIGGSAVPARVTYLVDLPNDARGKRLKLKGVPVLLFATTGATPGELRLVGPRAQVPRTPDNEARLRAILTEAVRSDAPPAITGITRAFHVAGSLPGEGETQIFLRTGDRRPISLSILRRPHEQPRWAVALSELVDDSAAPPRPDSLLWYRLACGLPRTLPDSALGTMGAEDAAIAREDYQVVLKGLGPCAG
ncbi:hypothetical protein [Sphingomonas crusticola]|uniref:hypothetical protein n=1 Tax=Sphingomonas crusticola TaxID=1697973 RepID=UPI001F087DD1|nr:hypothetical protein [Sphingomonas crusticola]